MKILVLTPIYPSLESKKGATPVVHYFVKQWVNMGYEVQVVHFQSVFPNVYYRISSVLNNKLSTYFGFVIPDIKPNDDYRYMWENVSVYRLCMKKFFPHSRYKKSEILKSASRVITFLKDINFYPDVILSHWANPQLEIIDILKKEYKVPVSLVMHDGGMDLEKIYKTDAEKLLENVDYIGYRSDAIRRLFESRYRISAKPFYCYSGIPVNLIPNISRKYISTNKIIYVGTLIKRKYPSVVLEAAIDVFRDNFKLTYIGDGYERKKINRIVKKNKCDKQVDLLGIIPREKVTKNLIANDVFIMVSKNETFGLVYLEAMASGCITIASKNEGFDGIIKDGINGFLCKAGSKEDLVSVISKINNMSQIDLLKISEAAIMTAKKYTDENAAKIYIDNIINN